MSALIVPAVGAYLSIGALLYKYWLRNWPPAVLVMLVWPIPALVESLIWLNDRVEGFLDG